MSRDLARENADLRTKLRDVQVRLRLLAGAVVAGDPGARELARMLLGGSMEADGVSQRPPSPHETCEPAAGSDQTEGLVS